MGTEQLGLSDLWMRNADLQVKIPMNGVADSLNVAMATTLLLYEAFRQRKSFNSSRVKNESKILYEDRYHVLAVLKPAGLLTQPSGTEQDSVEALAKVYIEQKYQKPGNVSCTQSTAWINLSAESFFLPAQARPFQDCKNPCAVNAHAKAILPRRRRNA